MNKIIKSMLVALVGAGSFFGGTYYATKQFDELLNNVMSEYEVISDRVNAFADVSNPKTIRKYTTELRKLLDDIKFLHILIESGQIADEKLDEYLATQQGNVDGLKETISSITTEVSSMMDSLDMDMRKTITDLDSNVKTQLTNSASQVTSKVDELNKQISSLTKTLDKIQSDINVVKKSKYGSKIWRQ